ncbi:MAG: hypothetical protein KGJ49_12975 [Alphaproteobacteria bacterium]|nr:hypothetical protein [Alphaproteobacteria bacterium]
MKKHSANSDLLAEAARTVDGRRKSYGDPVLFFENVARRWSITLGRTVTPAEAVLCMMDLKLTRLCHDPRHRDSVVDLVGYAAVLREVTGQE